MVVRKLACLMCLVSLVAAGCSLAGVRVRLNEEAARATLVKIKEAQTAFKLNSGQGRYGTLQELLVARLIDQTIATGSYRGYVIKIRATEHSFEAVAVPHVYGQTGYWSFFVNEKGILRGEVKGGQEATANDPPIRSE